MILTPKNLLQVKELLRNVMNEINAQEVAQKVGSLATSLFAENTCLERSNGDLFTLA